MSSLPSSLPSSRTIADDSSPPTSKESIGPRARRVEKGCGMCRLGDLKDREYRLFRPAEAICAAGECPPEECGRPGRIGGRSPGDCGSSRCSGERPLRAGDRSPLAGRRSPKASGRSERAGGVEQPSRECSAYAGTDQTNSRAPEFTPAPGTPAEGWGGGSRIRRNRAPTLTLPRSTGGLWMAGMRQYWRASGAPSGPCRQS